VLVRVLICRGCSTRQKPTQRMAHWRRPTASRVLRDRPLPAQWSRAPSRPRKWNSSWRTCVLEWETMFEPFLGGDDGRNCAPTAVIAPSRFTKCVPSQAASVVHGGAGPSVMNRYTRPRETSFGHSEASADQGLLRNGLHDGRHRADSHSPT